MMTPVRVPRFRLLRYFTLTSLAAFLLVSAPLMYVENKHEDSHASLLLQQSVSFKQAQGDAAKRQEEIALQDLLASQEAGNFNLTRVFANALWQKDFAPFVARVQRLPAGQCRLPVALADASAQAAQAVAAKACFAEIGRQIIATPGFRELDAKVFATMKKSGVFKVKVYDLRGITIYSSEPGQIGEDKLGNAGWQRAVAGTPVSELTHREKFSAFEGVVMNRDLISSYLPVVDADEKIVGVFEIYADVTPFLDHIKRTSAHIQKLSAENQARMEATNATLAANAERDGSIQHASIYGLLLLLYLALFLIVRYGQRIIDSQDLERAQALAALQESEERYRTMIEWSPDAIAVYRNGKVLYVNPTAITLFGTKSADGMTSKNIMDYVHPSYRQLAMERVKRIVTEGINPPMVEMKFLKLDKTEMDVEVQSTMIVLNGQQVVCTNIRDITSRKQAELALAVSQRRASVLAQLGHQLAEADTHKVAAIHILDAAQQLLHWDSAWLHLWDAQQQRMVAVVDFDKMDGEIREVPASFSSPHDPTPTVRLVMAEGPQLMLREAATDEGADGYLYGSGRISLSRMFVPIRLGEQLIGVVSIQSYALHAYDQADLDLLSALATHCAGALARLRHAEALRASDQRFRDLVDSTDGIVWEADATTFRFSSVSTNAERMLGYPVTDWLLPGFWASHIHPEDRDQAVQHCAACTGRLEDHEFEYRFIAQDGRTVWLQDIVKVVEKDGKPRWLRGLMVDITDRKLAEATRLSLEAQLREAQKMQAIGTLAGGIAHDFNNILATILGNAALARQDVSANAKAQESLNEIQKAATRARDLVKQILSFSRRQPTDRKLTALAPIIEESVRLLRATLPARITLALHCDQDVPQVLADATQIEQVVINLSTNAMHAMKKCSGMIDIRLDTVTLDAAMVRAHPALQAMAKMNPGRTVRLTVSDNGRGMDTDTIKRIFEPFFTTKPVDEGTGLGLSVVHGIVEVHEGAITVNSLPGEGSTFTLYLPVAEVSAIAALPVAPTVLAAPVPGADGGPRILYLDDDESLVFLVGRLLARRGFQVSGYTDQREALDALRADAGAFDLVVTDYNMPGMSGLDVAREVRAIRPDLPVAIASGFIDETLRADAEGAGVRELIFKASAVEDLCEAFVRLARPVARAA